MASASLFSSLLLSAIVYQALAETAAPSCCKVKEVTGPAGKEDLSGTYILKEKSSSKPDPNCADGCIYTFKGEEYCFKDVPLIEAATIECDATTGIPSASTKPPSGVSAPSSIRPSVTTKRPSGVSSPASVPGTAQPGAASPGLSTRGPSGVTKSPAARGQEAAQAKAVAETKRTEAIETQAAAEDTQRQTALVNKKIDDVKAAANTATTTPNNGRAKRAPGDPTVPPVPTTCSTFMQMIDDMTTAIALKTTAGYKTASALGTALSKVVTSTVACGASDVAALEAKTAKITEANKALNREIIQAKIDIKEATDAINAAIAIINQASKELVASGQTGLPDPGTQLPAVTAPTLPAPEATNPAGGATVPQGGQPGEASVTTGGQPGGVTPGGQPGEASTPGGQPGAASTPGGQPGAASTPEGQPGAASTPGGQPGEASTPGGQPGEASTPGGQPGRPTPVATTRGPPPQRNRRENLINHYLSKTV